MKSANRLFAGILLATANLSELQSKTIKEILKFVKKSKKLPENAVCCTLLVFHLKYDLLQRQNDYLILRAAALFRYRLLASSTSASTGM